MLIEIIDKSILEKTMILKLSKDEFLVKKNAKLKSLSESLNLKGFRKGLVPYTIITSRFLKELENEIVIDFQRNEILQFLKDNEVKFVDFPKLLKMEENVSNVVFYFYFEIYPEIEISLDDLSVFKYTSIISEDDINCEIKRLRMVHGYWHNSLVAKYGDKIIFDIYDSSNKSYIFFDKEVVLDNMCDIIPGFLDYVINKKLHFSYEVLYDKTGIKDTFNKTNFCFKLKSIKTLVLADLNDSFYEKVGFNKGYDFEKFIKINLERIALYLSKVLLKRDVLTVLLEKHSFVVPQTLVKKKEAIYSIEDKNSSDFKNEIVKTLKLELLLSKLGEKFNISVSVEEVKYLFSKYYSTKNFDDYIYKNIESEIYLEKIFDVLVTKINLIEKIVLFKELLKMGKYNVNEFKFNTNSY